jgi:hypothetical protein
MCTWASVQHNLAVTRGVDKFFKTLATLASSNEFSLAKSENNSRSGEVESVRGKQGTPSLHFTRRRVVIRTPAVILVLCSKPLTYCGQNLHVLAMKRSPGRCALRWDRPRSTALCGWCATTKQCTFNKECLSSISCLWCSTSNKEKLFINSYCSWCSTNNK